MSSLKILENIYPNCQVIEIDKNNEYKKFLDVFKNILKGCKDKLERHYPRYKSEKLADYLNNIIKSGYYDYRFHLGLLYEDGMDYDEPFKYIGNNRYICNSLKLINDIEDIFPAKLIYLRKEDENYI